MHGFILGGCRAHPAEQRNCRWGLGVRLKRESVRVVVSAFVCLSVIEWVLCCVCVCVCVCVWCVCCVGVCVCGLWCVCCCVVGVGGGGVKYHRVQSNVHEPAQ